MLLVLAGLLLGHILQKLDMSFMIDIENRDQFLMCLYFSGIKGYREKLLGMFLVYNVNTLIVISVFGPLQHLRY